MITRYGYRVVFTFVCLAVAISALAIVLLQNAVLHTSVVAISAVLTLFVLYFFRDPSRTSPAGECLVLSPADGKVILLQKVWDDLFLKSEAIQVSIFLSPLDVHVNRVPISGKIRYVDRVKGEYLVAFHEKASEKNERTVIGIENGKFRILMRQIAGFIARRIVCDLKVEDSVQAGERFGMIKFGSRVDVLVPTQAELKVRLSDRVVGGETVLAVVPS